MTSVIADLKKMFAGASFYFVGNAFNPAEPTPTYDITASWQNQVAGNEASDNRFFWTRRMWMVRSPCAERRALPGPAGLLWEEIGEALHVACTYTHARVCFFSFFPSLQDRWCRLSHAPVVLWPLASRAERSIAPAMAASAYARII